MLHDPRVRKLSFTGSTEVGRILLREAADNVISCSMELGGNAPFIVFDDADIPAAVEGALIAKMRNGGEACTAANRFYVHEAVADEFTTTFAGPAGGVEGRPRPRRGHRTRPAGQRGHQVQGGRAGGRRHVAGGAKVVTGGGKPDRRGFFYEPTLLDGVPAQAAILDTEIFGPVAPVVRFDRRGGRDPMGERDGVRPGVLRVYAGPGPRAAGRPRRSRRA